MVVQAFVTLALLFSFTAQVLAALTLVRWPLKFVLRHEWLLTGLCFIFNATASELALNFDCAPFYTHFVSEFIYSKIMSVFTGGLLFLAVSIFGGQCWRRDWLQYPNYNYVSWSYGFAVISFFFHGFAAFALFFVSLHYFILCSCFLLEVIIVKLILIKILNCSRTPERIGRSAVQTATWSCKCTLIMLEMDICKLFFLTEPFYSYYLSSQGCNRCFVRLHEMRYSILLFVP